MDYGAFIKRAWHITWRYKALWVLGIFAGVSGCQGGTPQTNSSSDWSELSGWSPSGMGGGVQQGIERLLPAIIAVSLVFVALLILWSVLSIAARGGLVVAVNEIEEGRQLPLGELWSLGFRRFWSLVGLGLLLNLPLVLVSLLVVFAIVAPLLAVLFAGGEPGAGAIGPVCGGLAVGIPLLLVLSFVLGIMYLVALRYVMLGGQGAVEAARNSWHFFRNRFKDSALMYLLSGALNIAASIVVAIPLVLIAGAMAIPMVVGAASRDWTTMIAPLGVGVLVMTAVGLFYNAVWGTFTSSLWTLFFRQVVGMAPDAYDGLAPRDYPQPYPPTSGYREPPQPPAAPIATPEPAPPPAVPSPPAPPAPPAQGPDA
ncbi:MAG TPA: hypothetical protein VLA05_02760 [Coriobacteriia bacterium]|nr:hypothetical protein [Coriobacteriia bacterium]